MVHALARHCPPGGWWAPRGLHVVLQVPDEVAESRLVAAAAAEGVVVIGIAGMVGTNPHGPAIVVSSARATNDMLDDAVTRLARAAARVDDVPQGPTTVRGVEWYEQETLQA